MDEHVDIFSAAAFGEFETLATLLDKLHMTNASTVNIQDDFGNTLLMEAAKHGRVQTVQLLLRRGASVNVTDSTCRTALHWAAGAGALDVVQALASAGASTSAVNARGMTASQEAARTGHDAVAAFLTAAAAREASSAGVAAHDMSWLSAFTPGAAGRSTAAVAVSEYSAADEAVRAAARIRGDAVASSTARSAGDAAGDADGDIMLDPASIRAEMIAASARHAVTAVEVPMEVEETASAAAAPLAAPAAINTRVIDDDL